MLFVKFLARFCVFADRFKTAKDKYALKKLSKRMHDKLQFLVDMVRGELTSKQRAVINALIIIEIHQLDVVESFIRDSVLSVEQFEWESQLRFYWFVCIKFVNTYNAGTKQLMIFVYASAMAVFLSAMNIWV